MSVEGVRRWGLVTYADGQFVTVLYGVLQVFAARTRAFEVCHAVLHRPRGALMSRRPAERRTQHAVMATASEWVRIRELAADAGMDLSRYIVHRASAPDPLPDSVLRRAVRELPLLARIEQQRMADMGLEERWNALGDAVDAWPDREAELDRLTDPGAAERWRAVSGSADPEGGPAPQP